jgi:small GTP-binding protein
MGSEIKIAILGNVSVGKTTLINALFRNTYGEVSMKRTTAGINYFHVDSQQQEGQRAANGEPNRKRRRVAVQNADDVLQEITTLNKTLRANPKIQEKHFTVRTDPLVDMLDDVELVFVDVPGLNESGGASQLYKDFVKEKWATFDYVIIVMDVTQGVNTGEQVDLLKFASENRAEIRDIPILVVINKVDDKEDAEIKNMAAEITQEVKKIFATRLLAAGSARQTVPKIIALSAEYAYIYRACSQLGRDSFRKLDQKYINKIGVAEFGRAWTRKTKAQKADAVHEIVSDEAEYAERLKDCNFQAFLTALRTDIGGHGGAAQRRILFNQVTYEMAHFCKLRSAVVKSGDESEFVPKLMDFVRRTRRMGKRVDVKMFANIFWEFIESFLTARLDEFRDDPQFLSGMHDSFRLLQQYSSEMLPEIFADQRVAPNIKSELEENHDVKSEQEESHHTKTVNRMKLLVEDKHKIIKQKVKECKYGKMAKSKYDSFRNRRNLQRNFGRSGSAAQVEPEKPWEYLGGSHWHTILESILLLGFDHTFCKEFGSQMIQLKEVSRMLTMEYGPQSTPPSNTTQTGVYCSIGLPWTPEIPESLESEDHWGYLEYKVCGVLKARESGATKSSTTSKQRFGGA